MGMKKKVYKYKGKRLIKKLYSMGAMATPIYKWLMNDMGLKK
jgi:hypothetical protein